MEYSRDGANGLASTKILKAVFGCTIIGDGSMMLCPALTSRRSPYSAAHYSPLLTTPTMTEFPGENPYIRSSYSFNPRVINAGNRPGPTDYHRRFRKTGQILGSKVFGLDLIGAGTTVDTIPHVRDKGLNALMTDGSVQFAKKPAIWNMISQGGHFGTAPQKWTAFAT